LDVKTDGSLKVKRRTLVITSYETSSNSKGKIKGEEQPSSHPITIRDVDNLKDALSLPKTLNTSENVEDFQHDPEKWQVLEAPLPLEDNA